MPPICWQVRGLVQSFDRQVIVKVHHSVQPECRLSLHAVRAGRETSSFWTVMIIIGSIAGLIALVTVGATQGWLQALMQLRLDSGSAGVVLNQMKYERCASCDMTTEL